MSKIILKLFILIAVIVLVFISGMILIYRLNVPKENTLTFCLRRTDGVSHWYYELSSTDILKETDCEKYYNIGSNYSYWEFSPIEGASGEVTVYFIDKEMALVTEENCFSITYYVDENGTITELSSDNKPEIINYNDNIIKLIKIRFYNIVYCYFVKLVIWFFY